MRTLLTLLLAGLLAAAAAQEPPGDDTGPGSDEPSAESARETVDDADVTPADESADADLAGPAATVEENPAIQATAEEEFDPDEEISEDYPVPLPSDI